MFFLVTLHFYEEQIYSENMYYTITLEFICKTFRIIFYLNFVHMCYILLRYNIHTYNIKQGRFGLSKELQTHIFGRKKSHKNDMQQYSFLCLLDSTGLVLDTSCAVLEYLEHKNCITTSLVYAIKAIKIAIFQYRPCLIYVHILYRYMYCYILK